MCACVRVCVRRVAGEGTADDVMIIILSFISQLGDDSLFVVQGSKRGGGEFKIEEMKKARKPWR